MGAKQGTFLLNLSIEGLFYRTSPLSLPRGPVWIEMGRNYTISYVLNEKERGMAGGASSMTRPASVSDNINHARGIAPPPRLAKLSRALCMALLITVVFQGQVRILGL